MTGRALLASVALLVCAVAPVRADIYRWVDADGRTHLVDDVAAVPEAERESARVFRVRPSTPFPAAADASGPSQAAFAERLARELGLLRHETQSAVSVLQIVGIYPATGWHPSAALSPASVEEVVRATRTAAGARRLPQSPVAAEAAALRVADALGVPGPPPTAVAAPPPPPAQPIVVAPQIFVEAPPPVVVRHVEPVPVPVLRRYGFGHAFGYGVPFATFRGPPPIVGPIPARITPLSNPAGRLHGPLVEPLRPAPFTRPSGF